MSLNGTCWTLPTRIYFPVADFKRRAKLAGVDVKVRHLWRSLRIPMNNVSYSGVLKVSSASTASNLIFLVVIYLNQFQIPATKID